MDLNWIFDILTSPYLFLPIIGYFCWHNIHDYNDLCDCVTILDTNDATIFVPNEQPVNENCTVPTNIMLQIIKGGSINVGEFSVRNASYEWTQSAGGTDEYYLTLVGGLDPGLVDPLKVYEDDVLMDIGTIAALAVGEWDWGEHAPDALGFDTIYVRLADGTDPDTKGVGWVEAGYVVTINGWVEAGAYLIFEGYGSVVLGPLATAAMHPEWYTG